MFFLGVFLSFYFTEVHFTFVFIISPKKELIILALEQLQDFEVLTEKLENTLSYYKENKPLALIIHLAV